MEYSSFKRISCAKSDGRQIYPLLLSCVILLVFQLTQLNDRILLDIYEHNQVELEDHLVTQFTSHVNDLVASLRHEMNFSNCPNEYNIVVNESSSRPPQVYGFRNLGNSIRIENEWTKVMERIFLTRTIPNSVRFGTTWGDYNHPETNCIGSSSATGNMTMPNFLILKDQARSISGNESKYIDRVPWNERDKVPIFRGTAWGLTDCKSKSYHDFLEESPRLKAVDFSVDQPFLLNAGLSERSFKAPCWKFNATNGLSKLLSINISIPPEDYYTRYQAALVLGGIGAAFRTSHHLSTGTAVILQEWHYQEWFTSLLVPWKHYIPLHKNLSNLEQRMNWIQSNNNEVKNIAKEGRKFYHQYLSFSSNEKHIHEFLYQLSIQQAARSNQKLSDVVKYST